jgi:hypothetical protein
MRLIPAATAASIAIWCGGGRLGSSLIGDERSVSTPAPGNGILFLCRYRLRP